MKKSYKKIFLLVFLFFSFFLIMPVSAIWSIKTKESQNLVGTNTSTVNVYVRYITKEQNQKILINQTTKTIVNSKKEDDYNTYYAICKGETPYTYLASPIDPVEENGEITWTETYNQIKECSKKDYLIFQTYQVVVEQTIYTYKQTISTTISNENQYIYTIPKGGTIEKVKLNREGYTFVNYFSANATNTGSSGELFDFSQPINQNTVIYAEWTRMLNNDGQFEENQLTDHINSLTSGSTSNIYFGNNANFDVSLDSSFSSQSLTVNLGSSSLQTTISSGTTVNFSMNDGRVDVEGRADNSITDPSKHTVGTGENITNDTYISLDYFKEKTETVQDLSKKNPRDYTIILQNDLIVNGNLYLGGYTGSSSSIQGYIVNNYVSLDLNGHQLIINNGGMVHSFGYIYDSMGTGSVEVMPGGNLKTQVVLYDVKGGNTTLWGFSKGINPFENYGFPYLNCEVHFYSNGNKVGSLDVFTKLNLGSLGVTNIYIPFFGKDTATYLMTYSNKDGINATITYEPYEVSALKTANNATKYNLFYRKYRFNFENMNIQVNSILLPVNVYIDAVITTIDEIFYLPLDRVTFPISSSIDLIFENSIFSVSQELKLMPGSSLFMDENSILNLGFYSENGNTKKVFSDIEINKFIVHKTLPGETKALSGGLIALEAPPTKKWGSNPQNVIYSYYGIFSTSYAIYWQYYQAAQVNIFGTVNFATGNDAPYILSGQMNIKNFTIGSANKKEFNAVNISSLSNNQVKLQTYSLDIELSSSTWFDTSDILSSSNDSAITQVNYFFIQPLTSFGVAYYKEATASEVLIGTYDVYTGIFKTTNQDQYIFYTDTNLLVDSSNTESAFNEITDLVKITNIDDRQIVNYNNSSYIYYSGIWCPVVESIMDESGNETGLVINTQKLSTEESYSYTRSKDGVSEKFTYSFSRTPMKYVSTTTYQVWQVIMKNFGDNGDNYTTKS